MGLRNWPSDFAQKLTLHWIRRIVDEIRGNAYVPTYGLRRFSGGHGNMMTIALLGMNTAG